MFAFMAWVANHMIIPSIVLGGVAGRSAGSGRNIPELLLWIIGAVVGLVIGLFLSGVLAGILMGNGYSCAMGGSFFGLGVSCNKI